MLGHLIRYHEMLKTVIGRMKKAMEETDVLSDISVAEVTKGYEEWGKAFISPERMVETLFKGL